MSSIPIRFLMMIILCIGTINLYSQRICLSIAVICMTNHSAVETNLTEPETVDNKSYGDCGVLSESKKQRMVDGPFTWDSQTRAHVLGVFFWGYLFGQIPAGYITQKLGARRANLAGLILLGLSAGFIPIAIIHSFYFIYALRIIAGMASALWFPGFYQIWASWAPPEERGLLVGLSYAGVHVGNALTLPIAGALCQTKVGWSSIFYFYGAAGLAYALVWVLFVYNTPTEHPWISDGEKKYIVSKCGDSGIRRKRETRIPILAMITSLPVWAFVAVTVGNDWNSYTMMTSVPTYMKDVLMFDINENAGLSALPFIGLWFGQLVSGWASDKILTKKLLSVGVVRKLMTAIGMFGPGLMMLLISLFDCRYKYLVVACFTLGLMLNSGVIAGGMLNPIEMSPKHAGMIFAGANTLGSLTGVLAPLVASILTPNKTYTEWRYVFYVSAAIYVVCGAFFILCSSSRVQSWAIDRRDYWSSGEFSYQIKMDGAADGDRKWHSEPVRATRLRASDKPVVDAANAFSSAQICEPGDVKS